MNKIIIRMGMKGMEVMFLEKNKPKREIKLLEEIMIR